MDNPYSAPTSTVSNIVVARKWYIVIARILCILLIAFWGVVPGVGLYDVFSKFKGEPYLFFGPLIAMVIIFLITSYPLYSFIKFTGKYPDRKARSVFWSNLIAVVVAVGLFGYLATISASSTRLVALVFGSFFSFPYLLNAFLIYRLRKNVDW
jgi:hypothetical protein